MISVIALMMASPAASVETTIREQRSAYNVAIAKRDLTAIGDALVPNYVVLPGLTGTALSKDDLLALFADAFRDPTFITYVRTPKRIVLSGSAKRVAETGTWAGTWNKPDGRMTVTGVYQAFWLPSGKGWKLINESFVTLACKGSRECASID